MTTSTKPEVHNIAMPSEEGLARATSSNDNVVLDFGPLVPWYENMTEVHNVSQRRQRRTEPRPQATCTNIGVGAQLTLGGGQDILPENVCMKN